MLFFRFCARHARRVLTSLLGLSLINVLYVIFRFEWVRDDGPIEILNQEIQFLQSGQSGLACSRPELELWPEGLRELFQNPSPLNCDQEQQNWVYIEKGKYYILDDVVRNHGNPLCEATPILRGADDFSVVEGNKIRPIKNL